MLFGASVVVITGVGAIFMGVVSLLLLLTGVAVVVVIVEGAGIDLVSIGALGCLKRVLSASS